MLKKLIVPLFFALFLAAAGYVVMAAARKAKNKTSHKMECTCGQSQGDMFIWESLGRTLATVASY